MCIEGHLPFIRQSELESHSGRYEDMREGEDNQRQNVPLGKDAERSAKEEDEHMGCR